MRGVLSFYNSCTWYFINEKWLLGQNLISSGHCKSKSNKSGIFLTTKRTFNTLQKKIEEKLGLTGSKQEFDYAVVLVNT